MHLGIELVIYKFKKNIYGHSIGGCIFFENVNFYQI